MSFRPADIDDMKWLWASYRKGGFPAAQVGLSAEAFERWVASWLFPVHQSWMLVAPVSERGPTPVGLLIGVPMETPRKLMLHALFFPWASPRNRVATLVNALNRLRSMHLLLAMVRPDDLSFIGQLCRYGIGKRVGTVFGWFDDGKDAAIFQSKDLI